VADYRPRAAAPQKLKKAEGPPQLALEPTVDILGELRGVGGERLVIGFAAETEHVRRNAERKRRSKGVDLMVANDVSRPDAGFEADSNAVTLIDAHGAVEVPLASKDEVADRILDRALALRRGRRQGAARQQRKAAPAARASR
jgi:phosphopantothenoylcysteine decarboxylase/phosphopantothenate--cysteine ligase